MQSPLPNWKKEQQLLLSPHRLHDDSSASITGNSPVSNLVTIDFNHRKVHVSCSSEENALTRHDHYLFLCLLWYCPEALARTETLLMLNSPQTQVRIYSMAQRADI